MNPFADRIAKANSNYCAYDGRRLVHPETGEQAPPLAHFVHDAIRALVLNDQFTCVGGKSAIHQNAYRFGLYSELGSHEAAAGLAHDLAAFVSELPAFGDSFATYIASFAGPHPPDELAFETDLWRTLQALHDLDVQHHAWDPTVSPDPADPDFSFSFAGTAFFVLGLLAASSRAARRFAWPTLVFNAHRQFEELRTRGEYARFQRLIRERDERLQGDVNPMMSDFGRRSEAVQYSGRRVDGPWTCPFHSHAHEDDPATD